MISTDAYYLIGDRHSRCQDFALAGTVKPHWRTWSSFPYAVLCDGCSSSPYSEIGSAALAASTVVAMRNNPDQALKGYELVCRIAAARTADFSEVLSGRGMSVLDCTHMQLVARDGFFRARIAGDGIVLFRQRGTGLWRAVVIESGENAPAYLSYLMEDRLASVNFEFTRRVLSYVDGELISEEEEVVGLGNWVYELSASEEDVDLVLLSSDGLDSYTCRGAKVELEEVLERLLKFKGLQGQFVQRRLNKFAKNAKKDGWTHFDDLSLAGIYVGD